MPIWEGTTNVLSLDVLRAVDKSNGGVLVSFSKEVHNVGLLTLYFVDSCIVGTLYSVDFIDYICIYCLVL